MAVSRWAVLRQPLSFLLRFPDTLGVQPPAPSIVLGDLAEPVLRGNLACPQGESWRRYESKAEIKPLNTHVRFYLDIARGPFASERCFELRGGCAGADETLSRVVDTSCD